jgi:hypothetical protein
LVFPTDQEGSDGYPQSHVMWHAVAPLLADGHTVVASASKNGSDGTRTRVRHPIEVRERLG